MFTAYTDQVFYSCIIANVMTVMVDRYYEDSPYMFFRTFALFCWLLRWPLLLANIVYVIMHPECFAILLLLLIAKTFNQLLG